MTKYLNTPSMEDILRREWPAPICINLGSGQRPFSKPWINIDCQERWKPDILARGEDLTTIFQPDTVDMIVLHHVLEHFGCGEAKGLVDACYQVLKPGGSLIVTVPDMRKLVKEWVSGRLTTQIFLTNVYGAYMGDPADRHCWGFVPETLSEFLHADRNWNHTKPFDFRAIEGADIARDDRWILGAEAVK